MKRQTLQMVEENHFLGSWVAPKIEGSPYYKGFLESIHPRIASYTPEQRYKAYDDLVGCHPRLIAEIAEKRNQAYGIPSYATSSRKMSLSEQKFLAKAMKLIQEEVAKKPFHMHGESGAVGDKNGNIREFAHEPGEAVDLSSQEGDKYVIHSHPPFSAPFDSSASEADHRMAAETYLNHGNQASEYLTNGKDVLHIRPDSMELVKLHPDPKFEKRLGKFPVAFTLPDPQKPPRPFANHEAPAAFRGNWEPPAGWKPPEDYPRARSAE